MKHYILSGAQSKFIDHYCINEMGIPSVVLMERAALSVAELIDKEFGQQKKNGEIKIVCHGGNNGADGLAVARILDGWNYPVKIILLGKAERATEEFNLQLKIIEHIAIQIEYTEQGIYSFQENDIIIDAIFGIGLSRNVQGIYAEMIKQMNHSGCKIISVDIPSGLNSDTGQPMEIAVNADYTVTFGNLKLGHKVAKGRDYCGTVLVSDIGFRAEAYDALLKQESICHTMTQEMPVRKQASNKGTYGKTAIIAGLGGMPGAAYFSAKASYKCGCGLVKIITIKENGSILKAMLPEGIYEDIDGNANEYQHIKELISGCSSVVIGPGLGTGEKAYNVVKTVMKLTTQELSIPVVMDADALNIIAAHRELLEKLNSNIIVTPHIKEMSRLFDMSCPDIMEDIVKAAEQFAKTYGCTCILKDATTVVASVIENRIQTYINLTGNSGMATGGSGDVLSGILGGLLAQKTEICNAAELGVYLHGVAGDLAADTMSEYGVMASDIVEQIPYAIDRMMLDRKEMFHV